MYGGLGGGGLVSLTGGAVILPDTGGNPILTIVAITSIVVGSAILLTTAGRWIAKKVYTKA